MLVFYHLDNCVSFHFISKSLVIHPGSRGSSWKICQWLKPRKKRTSRCSERCERSCQGRQWSVTTNAVVNVIQAKVVEFYNPGRFFLLAQNSEVMEALQIINAELQSTYRFQPATAYIPCVGEVCAVQYSFDMVSREPLGYKRYLTVIDVLFFLLGFF